MKFLFTLIGLVFILEGLPYLTFPEAMQRWLRQLMEMRPGQLRVVGLFAVGLGLLICYVTLRSSLFN
jgi:uncharacterized protein YjeT (DUF2065 family)|nr:DUF2065 domain-containing protein [Desulfobulbaceae bacterium]HKJ14412.1 DUF2065 domain-containing protein [Desulfobulbales bacterium]MDH3541411.1 DUF2065 domain-containing protein [Desulfobulbaceae bacterium]MDH3776170.1 DUF2065 domain-containing protein [Desulfobulbaceae bacterium]MDH3783268.1 DUF2065 domain-containing protein [Desulfobulbaceae bacterium]